MKIVAVHSDPETFSIIQEGLGEQFDLVEATVTEEEPQAQGLVPCDFMILDFQVPDPVETLRLIRTVEAETEVLLLLPSKYQFKMVSALFHYGIKDCLLRPFGPEEIRRATRKALGLPELDEAEAAAIAAETAGGDGDAGGGTEGAGDGDSGDTDPGVNEVANYLLDHTNLPMMPPIAMRIVRLCRNADVNAAQLEKLISGDQSFAGQLLKTANSALYRRAVPVRSINAAIVRVGLKNVNNLAIGLSASSLHKVPTPMSQKLWQESRTIASAAQVVAQRFNLHEDAYVAGLLHNVGMTLLNNLDGNRFQACLELQEDGMDPLRAEEELFGVDHAQLGSALATKWEIDQCFREAISSYPAPWKAEGLSKDGNLIASSIKLATLMMALPIFKNFGEELEEGQREAMIDEVVGHEVVAHMKLSAHDVGEIMGKLEAIFIQDTSD